MELNQTKNNFLHVLFSAILFFYVVSAIAFENTPETAFLSTYSIYAVFLLGALNVFLAKKIPFNGYLICSLLFCFYAYLMTIAPDAPPAQSQTTAYYVLTCTALCVIVFCNTAFHKDILKILIFANIVGALVLAVRIISAYGGFTAMMELAAAADGDERIGSMVLNTNEIGLSMSNAVICCLYILLNKEQKGGKPLKALVIFCAVFCGLMCFLTGSKKAVMFVLLGVLAIVVFYARNVSLLKKLLLLVFGVGIIVGIVYAIRTLPVFSTVKARYEQFFATLFGEGAASKSDGFRLYMVEQGLAAFAESPLFGKGTLYSYVLFETYSHNNFVEILMNYGLVGFALYYLTYIPLFLALWKRIKQKDMIAVYFLAFMLLQVLLGFGWVNYYDRTVQVMVAGAWGYLASTGGKEKERKTNEIQQPV